jgi:hypothetical protein
MGAQNTNTWTKKQYVTSALMFLQWWNNEREKFMDHTVKVMRPGFLTAMVKWKNNQQYGSTVVCQNQINSNKCFMATDFWGQKRCFVGGIHESRSNNHNGIVPWDIKTIKDDDSKQMVWPTDISCFVAWQRATPHCCAHPPAAQAIQVIIFHGICHIFWTWPLLTFTCSSTSELS